LYTDLGLLTCQPEFGEDATNFFNLLTGICQFQGMQRLLVAPFELHQRILALIEREAENARRGLPARIVAKVNSLAEEEIIQALYRASQAGVKIDLIVRGICCLRPGVKRMSENITVRSVVDRFLEHPRILCFENNGSPEVFLSSADWLPRNMFRRIELAFPIMDGVLQERIVREILALPLADNAKARFLESDGSYRRAKPAKGEAPRRSQLEFIQMATNEIVHASAALPDGKLPDGTFPEVRLRERPL
jgi:polyphosphate kinase